MYAIGKTKRDDSCRWYVQNEEDDTANPNLAERFATKDAAKAFRSEHKTGGRIVRHPLHKA